MRLYISIFFNLISFTVFAQDLNHFNNMSDNGNSTPTTYAIIIGINKYINITPLTYASHDAKSFFNLLVSPVFSINQQNISLLIDSVANRSNIYKEMYELEEKLKPNDLLIFYFAGHGDIEAKIQTNNSLLLLQQSPAVNYLRSGEYLDMNTLRDYFTSLIDRKVKTYFVCDACHAGNLTGGIEGQRLTSLNLQQAWTNEIKLLSCQSNELSQEGVRWGNGRGVFTYFLEKACQGMADNGDGKISLGEIKRYMETEVATSTNDKQNPVIIGDPKKFICNVNKEILAKAKANSSSKLYENVSLVNNTRGIIVKGDSLMNMYEYYLENDSELFTINENIITTATLLLNDNAASRNRIDIEQKLYEYCVRKFDKLIQVYYDGKPLKPYLHEFKDLESFLKECYPHFTNKLFSKEIYVKLKFLEIQSNSIETNHLNKDLALRFEESLLEIKLLSPNDPFIYKKLFEVLLASGKYSRANEEIANYILLLPNDPYAYNCSGMALFEMNEINRAIEVLQKAILLKPDYFEAYYNLGVVYSKIGRKNEAKKAFDRGNKFKQIKEIEIEEY